ncbi:MAG: hypothetical protein LBQ33_03605 [Oscillospiraceae bacterium]|jgi:hypothetical protein|nr:hypothetical protein [Oscillospiraceae bacterium]
MASYFDRVHRWGRFWSVSALCFLLSIPLAISVYFDAWPAFSGVLHGLLGVVPLFWATAVIELVSYAPLIGSGGNYLASVTGNIANLKLPCAMAALKNAEVRANSPEGEVVSTIAVAASSITTTLVIAATVLLLSPLLPFIADPNAYIAPAFAQVLPALFGSLAAGYFVKHWRIAFLPIAAGVLALLFAPAAQVGMLIPVTVIVSLAGALGMYRLGWLGGRD